MYSCRFALMFMHVCPLTKESMLRFSCFPHLDCLVRWPRQHLTTLRNDCHRPHSRLMTCKRPTCLYYVHFLFLLYLFFLRAANILFKQEDQSLYKRNIIVVIDKIWSKIHVEELHLTVSGPKATNKGPINFHTMERIEVWCWASWVKLVEFVHSPLISLLFVL
jgi:hypothetical protein